MFYPKNLQTQNEIAFFEKLKFVFPHYHIATQVALSAIIETDNYKERPQFNTYYVDYVICDKKGEKPLLIIELDDSSHNREKRKTQDRRKNGVIQTAGIPFIRYESRANYNITDIANNTVPYLNGSKTPPIYETLPIYETTQIDFNSNIFWNNIKKYFINKLLKLALTIIVFIIFLCFTFFIINTIGKSVTNSIKETQKDHSGEKNTMPQNKNSKEINETKSPVKIPETKTKNNTINKHFQKFITDSMKAGKNSIKIDKTPKNKNTNVTSPNNETENKNTQKKNIG
jgi:very-short-patch-repair endonuclease/Sec-independent protein translocase protein TatA